MEKESTQEINSRKVQMLEQHVTNPEYVTKNKQVFIIGSKGIPAAYGGFETFVEKLTEHAKSPDIRYHVARMANNNERYLYNNAKCYNVNVWNIGSAKAVYYDMAALQRAIDYVKARPNIQKPVFYVLACRIGPFIHHFKKQIDKLGGTLIVNPDGHEWMRAKWSLPVRRYWKYSESLMVKHADLLVCDSKNIEDYIQKEYGHFFPKTCFIAYGADREESHLANTDEPFASWLETHNVKPKEYYLVVGRFVPENNYETMIKEFIRSDSDKDFVLVTNISQGFLEALKRSTGFDKDPRIKFVGTVYDQQLLRKIREEAYGYFHGHEVGGTNPSLLEALSATDLNLLLDVGFNREVALDAALYWDKKPGTLAGLIHQADQFSSQQIQDLSAKARNRIAQAYSWPYIVDQYESLFLHGPSALSDQKDAG